MNIPKPAFRALEHLATYGPTFCKEIAKEDYSWYLYLSNSGLARMEYPDPNFLYQLPAEKRSWYQMKITDEGLAQYALLVESRAEAEQEKHDQKDQAEAEKIDSVKNQNKQFRHDYLVSGFGELVSAWLPHFFPKLLKFVSAFLKSLVRH